MLLAPHIGEGSPFLLMLMPAIVAAWYGGQGPGLAATAIGAAVTAFVFLLPAEPALLETGWWQLGVFAAQGAFVAVLSAARDRARDALTAANEKSAQILESITDAFVALDRDFRLTYVNRAAEKAIGATRSALIGRKHVEVFPEVFGSPFEKECRRAMADRVPLSLEYHSESSDRWYEVRAYPSADGGLSVYFRDITERIRQEEQARQLAAIVESSDDGIIGKTLDGVIVTWNEGAHRMYGYTAEEVLGRHLSMLGPPSCRGEMEEVLERLRGVRGWCTSKPCACARTAASSTSRSPSRRCSTTRGACAAPPPSRATSPSASASRKRCARHRSWRAWACSRAAWRTTSTTCSPASWEMRASRWTCCRRIIPRATP